MVNDKHRQVAMVTGAGQGIGRALTLQTLHDMAAQGYAYAIIGAAGVVEMAVGQEDLVQAAEAEPAAEQLALRALAAIYQEPILPVQDHSGWQSTPDGRR